MTGPHCAVTTRAKMMVVPVAVYVQPVRLDRVPGARAAIVRRSAICGAHRPHGCGRAGACVDQDRRIEPVYEEAVAYAVRLTAAEAGTV